MVMYVGSLQLVKKQYNPRIISIVRHDLPILKTNLLNKTKIRKYAFIRRLGKNKLPKLQ